MREWSLRTQNRVEVFLLYNILNLNTIRLSIFYYKVTVRKILTLTQRKVYKFLLNTTQKTSIELLKR